MGFNEKTVMRFPLQFFVLLSTLSQDHAFTQLGSGAGNSGPFLPLPSLTGGPLRTSLLSSAESEGIDGGINKDETKLSPIDVDWDWEQMANDVFSDEDKRPIILFDGVCNLCNSGINFAMDQDETAKFRFASLQSRVGQSLLMRSGKAADDTSNIVLVTEEDAFFSSDAVSRICMKLDAVPLQWFGELGQYTPPWIREGLYQLVSNNRYQFGENDQCRMDYDGTYTSRFVSDPIANTEDEY